MALEWTQALSVGVSRFDEQHKRFVELINRMTDALEKGRGTDVFWRVVRQVIEYTNTHFRDEENVMQATGYPRAKQHKALHDAFVAEIKRMVADGANGAIAPAELTAKLTGWLVGHIQSADKEYGKHLSQNGY